MQRRKTVNISVNFSHTSLGPFYGAIAVPYVTRCRCRCCCRRCRGHWCAGGVRQWRRATVATPGEWQCKTARSGEWAQHFSNASCLLKKREIFYSTGDDQKYEIVYQLFYLLNNETAKQERWIASVTFDSSPHSIKAIIDTRLRSRFDAAPGKSALCTVINIRIFTDISWRS